MKQTVTEIRNNILRTILKDMQKALSTCLPIMVFLVVLVCLSGCSHPTSAKTGSISGSVILLDETSGHFKAPKDFSGVTVELHALATIDTTLVRLQRDYPDIGVEVGQMTEFDHMEQQPIVETVTDVDGRFSFSSVPEGSYNVVLKKDGFGWKYRFNVGIGQEINDTLYYETNLNSSYYNNLELKSNHHYIVSSAITVSNLEIEDNCWLRFNTESALTVISEISTPTTNYSYIVASSPVIGGGFILNGVGNSTLKNLVFRKMEESLKVINSTIIINNCRFKDCDSSISSNISNLEMSQITLSRSDSVNYLLENDTSTYSLDSSVMLGSQIGVDSRNSSIGNIENCFIRSVQCLYLDAYTETEIRNCHLVAGPVDYVVKSMRSSLIQISDSDLFGYRGLFIRIPELTPDNFIHGNNFYTDSYALENSPNGPIIYQSYIFNAENNFFNTSVNSEIEGKVFHLYDQPSWYLFSFDYLPFRGTANPLAGIRINNKDKNI